jgi:hypothetical protein
MVEKDIPEINLDEIMKRIKEEASKRKNVSGAGRRSRVEFVQENVFAVINVQTKETIFYRFTRKVAQRLRRYGLNNFVVRVKSPMPLISLLKAGDSCAPALILF